MPVTSMLNRSMLSLRHRRTASSSQGSIAGSAAAVLLVCDVLFPGRGAALERLLDGDVGHQRVGRGAVPVALAGSEPHGVARLRAFHGAIVTADQGHAGGHEQGLPERMAVPGR